MAQTSGAGMKSPPTFECSKSTLNLISKSILNNRSNLYLNVFDGIINYFCNIVKEDERDRG